jgi:hypothetical protein
MKTESQIKEMIHRIGNYPNAIGAGEKQALEWVLNTDESAMCEADSNAVLADVRALLKIWPELKKTDMWGNEADWEIVAKFEKQIQKVSENFA